MWTAPMRYLYKARPDMKNWWISDNECYGTSAHWHFRYLDGGIKYQRKYSILDLIYDILPTLNSDVLMV